MSKEAFQQALASLSAEYREGLPARLQEVDALWTAAQAGAQPPEALRRALHSIAGSARTFGLPETSTAARAAEQYLDACCECGEPLPPAGRADFENLLQALRIAANLRQAT